MPESDQLHCDVCVVGGGPAGSTIGARLASMGHHVILAESQRFPRFHIGVSLGPDVFALLDTFQALTPITSGGIRRSRGTLCLWSEPVPVLRTEFAQRMVHVDRGEFDQRLLQHAVSRGVIAFLPAHVKSPQHIGRCYWQLNLAGQNLQRQVFARFLVDATGRGTLLQSQRKRNSPPLIALHATWYFPNAKNEFSRVEAGLDEWFWCVPRGEGRLIVAAFVDPRRVAREFRGDVEKCYRQLLEHSRLIPDLTLGRLMGQVRACDASSTSAVETVGCDFIKVGDASVTLDPLSSQGVQSAISSGLQAAIVVNTLLRSPESADAAIRFYSDRQREHAERHAAKTSGFYDERAQICKRPFWQLRGIGIRPELRDMDRAGAKLSDTTPLRLSDDLRIEEMPVIKDELVVMRRGICHPRLGRPAAFLEGVEIAPLLDRLRAGQNAREIFSCWSDQIPLDLANRIVDWLWSQHVLIQEVHVAK